MHGTNQDLDTLLQAYRDTVLVPEPGAHFMPRLWEKIDKRRNFTVRWKRVSQVFVGSAAVICLLITGIMVTPRTPGSSTHATYLDVLAEAHPTDNLAAQGIAHSDIREANQ